jgi:hypothetical protein
LQKNRTSASITSDTDGSEAFDRCPKTYQHHHKVNQTMNENDHDTEECGENYVNPYVLELRHIRKELQRERDEMRRKLSPRAFIDYLTRNEGKTGNVLNIPPPPPAFPPSQEYLDFVAMLEKQEAEEQRRYDAADEQRARASAREVAAVHAGV